MTSERLREIARALQAGASIVWDAGELFEAANMIDYLAEVRGCDRCHDKWSTPPSSVNGPPGATWQERASNLGARLHRLEDENKRPNVLADRPAAPLAAGPASNASDGRAAG